MTKHEVHVLVSRCPGITRAEIARALQLDPSTILKYLRHLRAEGQITFARTTYDKRRKDWEVKPW